jgi:ankyrin repeat protein
MRRKQWLGLILVVLMGAIGWSGYRVVHQAALNHELIVAATAGEPEPVRRLLDQGADPNTSEESIVGHDAYDDQTDWRFLFRRWVPRPLYGVPLSPLRRALIFGHLDANRLATVQVLLEHHADPNTIWKLSTPLPLRALVDVPNDRLLTLFLEHGANPNTVDGSGTSMLMYAVDARNESWVRAVLDHGAKVDAANREGNTALMWAAYYHDTGILKILLAHGAHVNHQDQRGTTALTYALIDSGPKQPEAITLLLAAGAAVNLPDKGGFSPFLFALTRQIPESGQLLAQGGEVHTAMPARTWWGRVEVTVGTSMRISNMPLSSPGTTPLMFAVLSGNVNLVRAILAKGPDVNARDAQGKTALYYCYSTRNGSKTRDLVKAAGAHF